MNNMENKIYTEQRPWGSFTILDEGMGYKVKKLIVNQGKRISLQLHNHRSENWIVAEGEPTFVYGNNTKKFQPGESLLIPKGVMHRIENNTVSPVVVIEIQKGDYLEEDDIIRFEDDFNRI